MTYGLGVDLGTTYTCAAIEREGRVQVVQLGGTSNMVPSVVSLRDDGIFLTGEAAERRAITDPARTVREFKRRFGDEAPYVIGGAPYGTEMLVSHLLRSVLDTATKLEGEAPQQVALTHPADYGPFKLELLQHAANLAGVRNPLLVPEPVAAAIAYVDRASPPVGAHLLVYDLGGGTFDAAVVRIDTDGPVVVGTPEGLARLGGIDFDQAVLAHVERATGGAVTALDSTDADSRAALARLRAECRTAKEALSDDTETEIPVLLPQLRTSVRLTREELESMVVPRLTDTAHVLERVVANAGVAMSDIAAVLLVGGSTRMPAVAQLVRQHTGRPVAVDTNPKTTIAAGAAVLAARAAPGAAPRAWAPPAKAAPAAEPPRTPAAPTAPAADPVPTAPTTTAAAPVPPPLPATAPIIDVPTSSTVAAPPVTPPEGTDDGDGEPRRGRRGLGIAAAVVVVVGLVVAGIVALGGRDGDDPSDAGTSASGPTAGADPLVDGQSVLSERPGSAQFGDALWAVTGATTSGEGTERVVAVTLEVTNLLADTGLAIDGATELAIRLGDSEFRSAEVGGETVMAPGGVIATSFVFRDIPEGTLLDGATFTVESAGLVPATITPDDFPPAPEVDPAAELPVPAHDGLIWYVGVIRAGVDALVNDGADGGYTTSQRRALEGYAWLTVDLLATASTEVGVSSDGTLLVVDGEVLYPWNVFSTTVPEGGSFPVEVGFLVPAGATTFELRLGTSDDGENVATLQLDARALIDQLGV